jgi:exonuclease III
MNVENFVLLSWNARGLDDPIKYDVVKDTIRESNAFIIYIQEMKLRDLSLVKFNTIALHKYNEFSFLPSNGSCGGTLTTWTPSYRLDTSYTLTT